MSDVTLAFDRLPLGDFFEKKRVAPVALDVPNLPEPVRALACRAWEDRVRSEYVGVMVMRRFQGLLVDVNAPMDLQELSLLMTLQEQQHANLCMLAARALGSDGEVAFDLDELQQRRTDEPLAAQVLEMVVGTFSVGEVTAAALIRHSIDVLPNSGFRDILRRIASDEVLHARIGPEILRSWRAAEHLAGIPWPGDAAVKEVKAQYVAAMRARDVVDPQERAAFEDTHAKKTLMAVGIPPPDAFKQVYLRALDELEES